MFAVLPSTPEPEPAHLSYSSDYSPREVLLADGSRITLDAATTVEALITQTRRELRLLTGQAVFDVTRDVHRPFRVIAGPMEIEVLGTVFNIDRSQPGAVSVTLLEGSLAVRVDKDRNGQRRTLAAGEQVSWNGLEGLSLASAKNVDAVAAWADGRVVFRGETLEQALARLNRYRPDPVKLPADMDGGTTVFGVFRAGDADALIRALEGSSLP
ncbi:MAG: FecR domain-containing protein [Pseudomonadales bacterium]